MDVTRDTNFPRAMTSGEIGVRAGFGFPVLAHGDVKAVLEFFSGRAEEPGRPILYGTGFDFLERFGLTSLDDLPPLDAEAAERLVE